MRQLILAVLTVLLLAGGAVAKIGTVEMMTMFFGSGYVSTLEMVDTLELLDTLEMN